MKYSKATKAFHAGFAAGVTAGFTGDPMHADASTEPYIIGAIDRALEEQAVSVDIDHDALTAILKSEEGL